MTIMYRVMNISEKKIYAWFYNLIDAEDYLKELGLGDSGVIDEVKIDNELADETEQLKQEYWKLKHRHSLLHDVCLDAECERDSLKKDVKSLEEENEQLKKRNNNQYNQLNQLWQLIEAKDWETLTEMNNQMKEDEERLQQEWKCYE